MLNNMQLHAYSVCIGNGNKIFITGSPGSGKSYLANTILEELVKVESTIVVATISHKAKKVLSKEFSGIVTKGVTSTTVAVVLGLALQSKDGSPETAMLDKNGKMIQASDGLNGSLLVIDEVSMVSAKQLRDLESRFDRVIAFGDQDQLRVINDIDPDLSEYETIELVENMRQENLSSSLTKLIGRCKRAVRMDPRVSNDTIEPDDTLTECDTLLPLLISGEIDVALCYTNSAVKQYNDAVQHALHGCTHPIGGDRLVLNGPMVRLGHNNKGETVWTKLRDNGDIMLVNSHYIDEYGFSHVVFNISINGTSEDVDRILIDKADMSNLFHIWQEHYKYKKGESMLSTNRLTYGWQMFKTMCISAYLPYAMSIHKSQGSTYDNVGVNVPDIIIAKNYSLDTYNRLMYVAVSRAKKKVYLMV
jgi:hypothetical protein